jgi:Leucine-rich repeat (LRR) protein
MKKLVIVFSMALYVVTMTSSCSKKGGTGGDDADDGNNPFFIDDLSVAAVTDSTVLLVWTATGDDGDEGTATSYDMRYWCAWITPTNWDSATQVVGEPLPKAAGAKESLLVTGLKKDSTYYFVLEVCDEADNCAGSNGDRGTCFTDYAITFPDFHLDSAVRADIGKPSSDIMLSDLRQHDAFSANDAGISDLSGMEHWKTLWALGLTGNAVTNLSPLSGLTNLTNLGLNGNGLSDLAPLATLSKLNSLGLVANHVSDLSPLSSLTTLTAIGLTDNDVANIGPLSTLVNLEFIQLRTNEVVDISALAGLAKLRKLDLSQNHITDLASLVANTSFGAGDTVWVGENPLSDEARTIQIPALQARGAAVLGL